MALDETLPYQDLTYKVIGAGIKVHNRVRPGLREAVYQEAMQRELINSGLHIAPEHEVFVIYEGDSIGSYRLDFFVEDVLVVELKALSHPMTNQELAQCLRYMQVTGASLGLLINFGRSRLEYRRVLPPRQWEDYNPDNDPWLKRNR